MKCACIILHYKNIKDTSQCLTSIIQSVGKDDNFQIYLVNNSPEQREELDRIIEKKKWKHIQILETGGNVGFAKGVNRGVKEALKTDAQKIALLNNDTIVPGNFLDLFFHTPSDIVGPVIEFHSNRNMRVYDVGGTIDWKTGRTKHKEVFEKSQIPQKPYHTDFVSGCCMVIPRDVFRKVGLFDERFFFYFEDVDFCVRAKKMGFLVTVDPNIVVYHSLGGSIGRWSDKAIYYNLRGNLRFILKHLGIYIPFGICYLTLLTLKIIYNRIMYEKN
ncbi:glycosyltransferase family 2 protein [Candidatus Gottesmanbacteria bacterium]|nr:glycosyltransferase family 2 protein [Candidatus Gottesmanbacteria bacterium]